MLLIRTSAIPFGSGRGIASRNDHQDALAAGLSVVEYAPDGKAALEIRWLWRWIEARLYGRTHAGRSASINRWDDVEDDSNVPWDACL